MESEHLAAYTIHKDETLRTALEKLQYNTEQEQAYLTAASPASPSFSRPFASPYSFLPYAQQSSLTLFVTDDSSNVIGTLTDEDIRRTLLHSGTAPLSAVLSLPAQRFMRTDFASIELGNSDSMVQVVIKAQKRSRNIRLIPVLREKSLVDVLDLTLSDPRPTLDVILMRYCAATMAGRRKIHDIASFSSNFTKIQYLPCIPRNEVRYLLHEGLLDNYYVALDRCMTWLSRISKRQIHDVEDMRDAIHTQIRIILTQYYLFPQGDETLGDHTAQKKPDFVIVLGCRSEELLQSRVEHAVLVAARNKDSSLVFSGGGWSGIKAEADNMEHCIPKDVLPDFRQRIIFERYSMDTVGNAVFSRLIIRRLIKEGKLDAISDRPYRICVVTSPFHAIRALNIFRVVFGHVAEIAIDPALIDPVITVEDGRVREDDNEKFEQELEKAEKELRGELESSHGSLAIEDYITGEPKSIIPGDIVTIFYQMILNHKLYESRVDLLREFGPVLEGFNS